MESAITKPNVIMILLDGARADRVKIMKNFNGLIQKSTFFSQMITYAPYTIASMHAIFSGSYGNRTGVDNYYGTYTFKKDNFATITNYLKDSGYYTIGDILNPLVIPEQNFDDLKVHDEYSDDLTLRHSGLLEKVQRLNKEGKPCFVFLHYSNIHTSIKINVSKKYDHFSKEFFSNKERNLTAYDGYLTKADDYVAAILKKIEDLGLSNSLILMHSDHGISIGERPGERNYGAYCYDYTLKTFALFYHPDLFQKKEVISLTRTIDILPTLLDYLKISINPKYEEIDGLSTRPLIEGKIEGREAFCEAGNPHSSNPPKPPKAPNCRAYRTEKYKFIHNYWDDSEELYNLENDPQEDKNIINENKEIAQELREKLNKELRRGFDLKLKSVKNLGDVDKSR